jgi:hypothetical protein
MFYVVAAPIMMAIVALLGGNLFATIGGAIAIVVGPIIYGLLRLRNRPTRQQ